MRIIDLPLGGQIVTDGRDYESGALVHILDRDKEMVFRAIREEFAEKPEATMASFWNAIAEIEPNLMAESPDFAFNLGGCYLIGNETFAALVHDYETFFGDEDENEIIYYAVEEWRDSPEEVIGALLNCLAENI